LAEVISTHFDTGDDISIIGTGEDELCSGQGQVRDLLQHNFADATANRFEWHSTQVTVREDTGVIAITLTIHLDIDGEQLQIPLRWTVACKRHQHRRVWLYRHASSAPRKPRTGQGTTHQLIEGPPEARVDVAQISHGRARYRALTRAPDPAGELFLVEATGPHRCVPVVQVLMEVRARSASRRFTPGCLSL
jgi:hypothetical protein